MKTFALALASLATITAIIGVSASEAPLVHDQSASIATDNNDFDLLEGLNDDMQLPEIMAKLIKIGIIEPSDGELAPTNEVASSSPSMTQKMISALQNLVSKLPGARQRLPQAPIMAKGGNVKTPAVSYPIKAVGAPQPGAARKASQKHVVAKKIERKMHTPRKIAQQLPSNLTPAQMMPLQTGDQALWRQGGGARLPGQQMLPEQLGSLSFDIDSYSDADEIKMIDAGQMA